MTTATQPAVLVTGASSGIGAIYADRFARRGHDLFLVARDETRLAALAERLRTVHGAHVTVERADLTEPADLGRVEQILSGEDSIGVLVNDAGVSHPGEFAALDVSQMMHLITLNVTAPTRLSAAIVPRLIEQRRGAIITVGSMVGLMPDYGRRIFGTSEQNQAVYGATKAYLLYLSQSLHGELAPKGVYVQVVIPAAVRTAVFDRTDRDASTIPGLMEPDDFVDAALVGFDRREAVTMPSLPDDARWREYDHARVALVADVGQSQPAARYLRTDRSVTAELRRCSERAVMLSDTGPRS